MSTTLDEGGAQRVTSTLLRLLDRERIAPRLCVLRDRVAFALPHDVPVYRLVYRGIHTFFRTARRLQALIRETQPDVVMSNVNATNILTGWALRGMETRVPWVARVGNSPVQHDRGLRRWATKRAYVSAVRIVANSRGLADEMRTCLPSLAPRVEVVGNPTDFVEIDRRAQEPAGFGRPARGVVMLAVGRLSKQKRYDVMLRAFARLPGSCDAELWICGDGPERLGLGRLAERLGIATKVRWLGFVANPYAVMRLADLFVMTSDHEGLPNALIEAQGLGLPAVATRCPHGPDEIIEQDTTGCLVPTGDVEAVTAVITAVIGDPDRRSKMGAAARKRVRKRFPLDVLTRKWEDVLERAREAGPPMT